MEALKQYEILDTPPEPVFDEAVKLAATLCDVPMAVITILDERRQWFKASVGMSMRETPRDIAFCAVAIAPENDDLLIIHDAQRDPRFAENPLVTGEPHIRFYAGACLRTPTGEALGTIAVFDRIPRRLTSEQKKSLRALARQVMAQLEMRRSLSTLERADLERAWAEEAQRRAARRLPGFDAAPDIMMRFSRDLKVMYVSASVQETLGVAPAEFMDRPIRAQLPPRVAAQWEIALSQTLATGQYQELEFAHAANGGERIFQARFVPEFSKGEATTVLAITRDITVLRLTERELAAQARQQQTISVLGQRALQNLDLDTLFQETVTLAAAILDAPFCEALEIQSDGATLRRRAGVGWPADSDTDTLPLALDSLTGQALATGQVAVLRDAEDALDAPALDYRAADGTRRQGIISGVCVTIPGKLRPFGVLGIYSNRPRAFSPNDLHFLQALANVLAAAVTRRRDEDELRRLSLVASKTANGVLILDAEGRAEWANDAFTRITGYAQGEMQERDSLSHLSCDLAPEASGNPLPEAPGQRVERLCNHRDGRRIWLEIEQTAIDDAQGGPRQTIVIIADATERREAQDALRQREQTYRLLTESMSDMVSLHEMNGLCVFVSPSVLKLTGFTVEETIGKSFYEWTHPDDQALIGRRASERNLLQRPAKTQWRRRRRDGSYIWLETQTDLILDAEGRPHRLLYASRDISERKQAEEHIAERARLADFSAAIGQAVTQTRSPEPLLQACAEAIVAHFNAGLVRLWTWRAGEEALRLQAEAGYALTESIGASSRPLGPIAIPPDWAAQPDLFGSALERLRDYEIPLTAQLGLTAATYPLIIENRLLGALSLFLRGPLSGPAQGALNAAADSIALGLQRCWETQTLAAQTAQLAEALDEANRAAKLKSEFVAAISHEIRTPLHGVIGMTDLLMETELLPEQRELGEMARASADILLRLLNDILDFSKIEAGRLSVSPVAFDLCQIIEDTAEIFAPRAHEKGLDIAAFCDAALPPSLIGDAGRIQQIITNLTDNAVKFTAQGAVSLTVDWQPQGERSGQVVLSVSDTGVGIAPDSIEQIFEPFTQASPGISRQGGTGLGLTISRQIAALMGGTLNAVSVAGQGSTFRLTLPLERDPALADAPPVPESPLKDARILLLAGSPLRQEALQKTLSAWQAQVILCEDAVLLLPLLREAAAAGTPFQMAILDDAAPGMADFAPVRALLAESELRETRMALLIAPRRLAAARALREAGVGAWMRKPVRQSHLRDTLTALLISSEPLPLPKALLTEETPPDAAQTDAAQTEAPQSDETQNEIRPPESVAPEAPLPQTPPVIPSLPSPDGRPSTAGTRTVAVKPTPKWPTGPRVLVAEDNIISQKIAALILEKIGCRVEAVSTGTQALRRLETETYDLILMDCQMPELDGYDTAQEIRRRESRSGRRTPIIAMTANLMPGASDRCLQAGMDAYLSKPIQQEMLLKMARSLFPPVLASAAESSPAAPTPISLAAPASAASLPDASKAVAPAAGPLRPLNREALLGRVGGNPNLLRSLTKLYAAEWPKLRQEIAQALDARDKDAFQRGAHKLRGVLMSLEADAGVAVMRRLELSSAAPDWPENAVRLLAEVTEELQRLQQALDAMQE